MRGNILDFDQNTGRGIILGEDSNRYEFTRYDLKTGECVAGDEVDFVAEEGDAKEIYSIPIKKSEHPNKYVAAALAFFFGVFGIHKFYLGRNRAGVIMAVTSLIGFVLVIPLAVMGVVSFVEFVLYIIKTEDDFRQQYVVEKRSWF